jgi:superfamily II DNA or RNA helicase
MMSALVENKTRNRLIIETIARELKEGRRSLVLTERVEHAEYLAAQLSKECPHKVAALIGNTRSKEREAILNGLREGSIICVCSTRLADEGLDVPQLERLFLVTPSRDPSRVKQRIGRVMRIAPGKASPVLYDFIDHVGLLEHQAKKRWETVYRGLVQGNAPSIRMQ